MSIVTVSLHLSDAIAALIAILWSFALETVPPVRVQPVTEIVLQSNSIFPPNAFIISAVVCTRSLSFARSLYIFLNTVVPSAAVAATQRTGTISGMSLQSISIALS